MASKLSKGTVITLHGTDRPLTLAADAVIEEIPDQEYVGLLLMDKHGKHDNWDRNTGNYEGNYNRMTGVRVLPECSECGREILPAAVNQKTCESCMQIAATERETAKAQKIQADKFAAEKKDADAKSAMDKKAVDLKAAADKKAADAQEVADKKAADAKSAAGAKAAAKTSTTGGHK